MSPAGNSSGGKLGTKASAREAYAAFDRLPLSLRELFRKAPVNFNSVDALAMVRERGERAALRAFTAYLNSNHPGWEKLK